MTIAAELMRAAATVAQLELDSARNHVRIESQTTADDAPKIDIHGCEPEQLEHAASEFAGAKEHRDADDIVRWVEAEVNGCEITWFRR